MKEVKHFHASTSVAPAMTKKPFDNRPHLEIFIKNHKFTALLDTGAMSSILGGKGFEVLRESGIGKILPSEVGEIQVANGASSPVTGIIALEIQLGCTVKTVKFLIVPKLAYEFLLGADFCRIFQLSLHFDKFSWHTTAPRVAASEGIVNQASLTLSQQKLLDDVIKKFATLSTKELGRVKGVSHTIDTGNAPPVKTRQYPLSPAMQAKLRPEISQMLKDQVIQPSNSPWCSPLLLIRKRNGELRPCFDGRSLNKVTKKDAFPLKRPDCILNRVRQAKFLTSIDLRKAFWQIPLDETSREKTAFVAPGLGLFEFLVMPFGITNAPKTLQRTMEKVLGSILHQGDAHVYLDDMIVASSTFDDHIKTLNLIFEKLNAVGFRINIEKCEFCRSSLKFLGFVVDDQGLRTDPEKVEAITRFRTPTNTTEVKRLIGLISYYRIFLPNLSTISSPITALIKNKKKGQTISWNSEAEAAFSEIKKLITVAPILISPNFDEKFFIQTDASLVGVGAVLFQEQGGLEHPIAYASRALSSAEQKYAATERELLAMMFAIEKFRGYIEGTEFVVISDCSALQFLTRIQNPSGRLARWAMQLGQYEFEVRHRPGKLNIVPDVLSRDIASLNIDRLIPDEWYSDMLDNIRRDPDGYPHFKSVEDRLYKFLPSSLPTVSNIPDWKLVVPTANRPEVLKMCHDEATAGHFGVAKTTARVVELYYWPKLKKDVINYVSNCRTCAAYKNSTQARPGLMGQYKKVSFPFQLISVDLLGPLPRSKKGNQHLLVVTDWFTKFVLVQPLAKATAAAVVRFMENQVFLLFGVPQIIICDNGVQFISKEFKKLTDDYHVQGVWKNDKFHAQNNFTERVNKTLVAAISSYVKNEHKTWDENIYKIAQAIRTAKHDVTEFSPAYLMFGRYVPIDGSFFGPFPDDKNVVELEKRIRWDADHVEISDLYRKVRENLKHSYDLTKKRYDLRKRPLMFQVGDKVWKKNYVLSDASKNFAAKLAPKYVLCTILKKVGNLSYELVSETGKNLGMWHVKDLKPFRGTDLSGDN